MKLLFLTPELPFPPSRGYSLIAFNHIRELAARHSIDLLTFGSGDEAGELGGLRNWCHRIDFVPLPRWRSILNVALRALSGEPLQVAYYASSSMHEAVAHALERERYDVVFVQLTRMAQFLPAGYAGGRVLAMVDPFVLNYRRSMAWRPWYSRLLFTVEANRLQAYESSIAPRFDRALLLSEADARDYAECVPGVRYDWTPHAVDAERFTPSPGIARDPKTIVITGSMFHAPNADAVDYFCREIFPLVLAREPDARLWVVGNRPTATVRNWGKRPNITVTGSVPDVRPYLNKAMVSVCPVRLNVGTQTKVLESLAMGTPVVTTSAGNHGIRATPGEHLYVADQPADFADRVVSLLRGEDWSRLSEVGRQFVRTHFSWGASAARLEQILREVRRDSNDNENVVSGVRGNHRSALLPG